MNESTSCEFFIISRPNDSKKGAAWVDAVSYGFTQVEIYNKGNYTVTLGNEQEKVYYE